MRSNRNHSVVILLMVIALGYSCENIPDCRNEISVNTAVVRFYDYSDSTLTSVKFDSIKALNTDSIFYLDDSLNTYNLILDPSLNQSTFLFYQEDKPESLSINYARNISIISEDCGPEIIFSELQIESYTYDSAALINNMLNQSITKDIEIYF